MLPRVVEELMFRGGCLFWGTPGLGMAVLGEATQPGEGTAMEGDLSLLGEPVGERTLREERRISSNQAPQTKEWGSPDQSRRTSWRRHEKGEGS